VRVTVSTTALLPPLALPPLLLGLPPVGGTPPTVLLTPPAALLLPALLLALPPLPVEVAPAFAFVEPEAPAADELLAPAGRLSLPPLCPLEQATPMVSDKSDSAARAPKRPNLSMSAGSA